MIRFFLRQPVSFIFLWLPLLILSLGISERPGRVAHKASWVKES
jgi:hypothetical protein